MDTSSTEHSNKAQLSDDDKAQVPVDNDVDETDLSFAAILKGTAANPLNTFEKKAALINIELDKFGMGKYQICIWFLCGFGYFLDLAWSQGVGLIVSAIYQEVDGVEDKDAGNIFSIANAGLAVGALFWGLAADVIGRKWAFYITCLITSVFGLLLAAPKYNYPAICAIYFLASLGLGGNIPIDATIALEFLPTNRRFLVALLSMWQPIGVAIASAIAYGTAAKWRCDLTLPSCRAVASGEPCCTSPKYLLGRGKEAEAIAVLRKIALYNKQPPPALSMHIFAAIDEAALQATSNHEQRTSTGAPTGALATTRIVVTGFRKEMARLKGIFSNKLSAIIFGLLAIAYMGDYWSFNLASNYLPIILLRNNVDKGQGSVSDTYEQYLIIYFPGILGALLALLSIQMPLLGRKWSLVFSALCQGLSMAMYTQVSTTAAYVGLNALEYIMQTYFNAVLYASAPELFDTVYRGSVSGMLSCIGRLAGIVAPYAGAQFLEEESEGILWLGAGGIWIAAVVMVFLPVEMRGRQMF
ncbi:MFS general substrate transporter [Decorospora gaudefroyi]|uniref:MFS general substrate transporter n=1 Tax=Decorospora gaudefroyi TaxID=184978 RepID=A0A6A5KM11_9PLEO|nr:MFS general substrate transporter [Decorospora gaudefroyi]